MKRKPFAMQCIAGVVRGRPDGVRGSLLTPCASNPSDLAADGGCSWSKTHAQRVGKHTDRNLSNSLDRADEISALMQVRERSGSDPARVSERKNTTDNVLLSVRREDAEIDGLLTELLDASYVKPVIDELALVVEVGRGSALLAKVRVRRLIYV